MLVESLVQLRHESSVRAVACVMADSLVLLSRTDSVFSLAQDAMRSGISLAQAAERRLSGGSLAYDRVYHGQSLWKLLPPIDHPSEPSRLLLSGTGLTHKASVDNRNAMHGGAAPV